NVIAMNSGPGIIVSGASAYANPILGNSTFGNGGLGIDLGDDGVTLNHSAPSTGLISGLANGLQNFPILTSAAFVADPSSSLGTTIVTGSIAAGPSRAYLVQFFVDTAADPSGYDEGQSLLATVVVSTDSAGNA